MTANSDMNAQAQFMQAVLAQMKPEQAAPIQAAIALQQRKMANRRYMEDTIRKIAPCLTNGVKTQNYALGSSLTFNMPSTLNGYIEGIVVRYTVNYTLAAGTSAVYGKTAAGALGLIKDIEVRYNKSQIKERPQVLRHLAMIGALDEFTLPDAVLTGQQNTSLQNWVSTDISTTVGSDSCTIAFYWPFNMIRPNDTRGLLPFQAGDTGIQVIVNTPQAILGTDAADNSLYAISGTGHAVSSVSGTVEIDAVYRDGDCKYQTAKLPFDISLVEGTFQQQQDQSLSPLQANTLQFTKLNIMGYHYYTVLLVIDGNQPNKYCANSNILSLVEAKDAIGANTFRAYGDVNNLDVNDYFMLERMNGRQDLDEGVIILNHAPVNSEGQSIIHDRLGKDYLDNTRQGWSDWRYGIKVGSVGTGGNGARIEAHDFFVNPTGLVPVQ